MTQGMMPVGRVSVYHKREVDKCNFADFEDVKPLWDRVCIRKPPLADESPGGITYADETKERAEQFGTEGEVIAVGPDVKTLKVGDWVYFSPYAGLKLMSQNKERLDIMKESDIIAVYTGEMVEE